MSGVVSALSGATTALTGLPVTTSLPGFLGTLQVASFRGVPFLVDQASVKFGRRIATHQYPFRDGGWPEDMGRAMRVFSFTGHLVGDLAPVMQAAVQTVTELQGSGILVHPSIGAVNVAVESASTSISWEEGRVVRVAFTFVEDAGTVFPTAIIGTAAAVLSLVLPALVACNSDLGSGAGPAASLGPSVVAEASNVVTAFNAQVALAAGDPNAIVGLATGLPPPDARTWYGRYSIGAASQLLPDGSTVDSLEANLAAQRATLAVAASAASTAAASFSAATDMMTPLSAVVGALTAGIIDPAAQVRILLNLANFAYVENNNTIGLAGAIATMGNAMAAACRRSALIALAEASQSYQPTSYNDALAVLAEITAALDAEITLAADSFENDTYLALKQLRSAVNQDLITRGASLPSVVTVSLNASLPTLTIAQMLYKDASRSDQLAAATNAIHPAFCPPVFTALGS